MDDSDGRRVFEKTRRLITKELLQCSSNKDL